MIPTWRDRAGETFKMADVQQPTQSQEQVKLSDADKMRRKTTILLIHLSDKVSRYQMKHKTKGHCSFGREYDI